MNFKKNCKKKNYKKMYKRVVELEKERDSILISWEETDERRLVAIRGELHDFVDAMSYHILDDTDKRYHSLCVAKCVEIMRMYTMNY